MYGPHRADLGKPGQPAHSHGDRLGWSEWRWTVSTDSFRDPLTAFAASSSHGHSVHTDSANLSRSAALTSTSPAPARRQTKLPPGHSRPPRRSGFRILVDRHDHPAVLHASQVLDRPLKPQTASASGIGPTMATGSEHTRGWSAVTRWPSGCRHANTTRDTGSPIAARRCRGTAPRYFGPGPCLPFSRPVAAAPVNARGVPTRTAPRRATRRATGRPSHGARRPGAGASWLP